jgi:hypothetical protein
VVAKLREEHRLRVFENRVLGRMFGPKREEVTAEWRKLQNEKLNDLHYSSNSVRVNKSRNMRWAVYITRRRREGTYTGFWWGHIRETGTLGDPGVCGRIILICIFRK